MELLHPHLVFIPPCPFFSHALLLWGLQIKRQFPEAETMHPDRNQLMWATWTKHLHSPGWDLGTHPTCFTLNTSEDSPNERCWSGGGWSPILISQMGNGNAMCPDPDPHDQLLSSALGLSIEKASTECYQPGRGHLSSSYVHLGDYQEMGVFNTAEHLQSIFMAHKQALHYPQGVLFCIRAVPGFISSSSCSSILPASGMLGSKAPVCWSLAVVQLVHRRILPSIKIKGIKSWLKSFVTGYKVFFPEITGAIYIGCFFCFVFLTKLQEFRCFLG